MVAIKCSRRSSIHLTGRQNRSAATQTSKSSDRDRITAEPTGEQVPIPIRNFRGAVQFERVARCIVARDRPALFERHPGVAPDREFELYNGMRGAKCRFDIAVALA
ncbi:MAG: hypothetical protein Q8M24_08275 [Pseudolabrys sp.]|nr:hypothetical protein [Pseudolabrys sp.]